MYRQNLLTLIVLIFAALLISGCSGGSNSAVIPNVDSNQDALLSGLPVGVSDWNADMAPVGGIGALGVFNLHIDPLNLSAELVPLRENMLTDVLEVVDITNFLSMAPCSNCATIDSISLDVDGNLVVSIGLRHPFDAGDTLKPITGKNRADLHVLNVEGIIVSNSSGTIFSNLNETVSCFTLVNADGYSGYLDDVLDDFYTTDATIHPYILHFDDYTAGNFDSSNPMGFQSVTDPPPSGNLVMAMGCDYDYQDYVFNLGTEPIDFIYAIGCTYAVSSAGKNERFSPEYRIPQHNKKAASEVSIEEISNDLAAGNPSSTAEIEIHVVDISHDVTTGSDLDQMFADSSVSAITIDLPGVESAIVNVDILSPTGTGHDPIDPLVFPATIINSANADEGTYAGLVKVVDSYSPGLNESPLLNGMDGITRVEPIQNPLEGLFQISEFATYTTFSIDVESGNLPPVAVLEPDPVDTFQFQSVEYDATSSYDTDGTIDLYEFDFDWDEIEVNFSVDASNTTGMATSPTYDVMGSYHAGVRVTDDLGEIDYASVEVTVSECGDTLVSWGTSLPDMTSGRYYSGHVVIGHQLWIIGGRYITSVEVFDLDTETWDSTPRAPQPRSRDAYACSHYDGKIYCMGGYSSGYLGTQDVYDIASNTWDTSHPDIPSDPRSVLRSVTYQDEIYLCFGYNWMLVGSYKRLDIYDPVAQTWRSGADANYGRSAPIWVVVGDRIYATGNNNSHTSGYNRIEYYEPATDSWTLITPTMSRWRGGPAFVAIGDEIYLMGGHQNTTNSYNWVDSFDTTTETWRQEIDLPEDRGFSPAAAYYKCKIYLAAGRGDSYLNLRSVRDGIFE